MEVAQFQDKIHSLLNDAEEEDNGLNDSTTEWKHISPPSRVDVCKAISRHSVDTDLHDGALTQLVFCFVQLLPRQASLGSTPGQCSASSSVLRPETHSTQPQSV